MGPWFRELVRGFLWTRGSHCTAPSRTPQTGIVMDTVQKMRVEVNLSLRVILLAHQPQLLYSVTPCTLQSIRHAYSSLLTCFPIKIIPCKTAALMRQISLGYYSTN